MEIDCERCAARGPGCGDCVVTVLLGAPPDGVDVVDFDDAERAAIAALADGGLIPPLRLAPAERPRRRRPPRIA